MHWFLLVKKKMKFCICCCLFDCYVYKISTKRTFSLCRDVYKEKYVGYTFTLCTIDCFIHVYYTCAFTLIKIKILNDDRLNKTLRQACHTWLCDSHISRMQGTTKACYQNMKVCLERNDYNANYAMSVCCFECLSANFYMMIFIL